MGFWEKLGLYPGCCVSFKSKLTPPGLRYVELKIIGSGTKDGTIEVQGLDGESFQVEAETAISLFKPQQPNQ